MAHLYKTFPPVQPSAGEVTLLYFCPPDKMAVLSTLTVCNQGALDSAFRLAVVPAGDTLGTQHYRFYDHPIRGNRTNCITVGITLNEGAALYVYSGNASLSFSIDGVEIDEDPA